MEKSPNLENLKEKGPIDDGGIESILHYKSELIGMTSIWIWYLMF